jgi:hypothetical protein
MKRELFFWGAVLLTANIFAQATQTMSHQAVIRNSNDDLVASSPIGMRVSILQGSETGTPVYVETHSSATDEEGIVSIELGSGQAVGGAFSDVDWSAKTIFLKTETDPSGGTDYSTIVGTSPYTGELSALVATHYVGEYYGGGIVFYVDDEGKHGLITTTIDKSIRKLQKSDARILTNTVRDGITTGKFNEDRINAIKGTGANDALSGENYPDANLSDWYLPTRYDLIKLYQNRVVIGGYSAFARGWRSAEFSSVNEWYRSFVTGGEFRNGKDDEVYVRVIREF